MGPDEFHWMLNPRKLGQLMERFQDQLIELAEPVENSRLDRSRNAAPEALVGIEPQRLAHLERTISQVHGYAGNIFVDLRRIRIGVIVAIIVQLVIGSMVIVNFTRNELVARSVQENVATAGRTSGSAADPAEGDN